MVVNNPNNWHWVDKNCLSWSSDYFKDTLVGLKAEKDSQTVKISAVSSVEGDCEVSQRKGKVISLFDMKLVLKFDGFTDTADKSSDVSGSITVPELAYDTEEHDLQFDVSIYNETNTKDAIRALIRTQLLPQLRQVLGGFGGVLIKTNSSDIQLESDKVNSVFTKSNQEAHTAVQKAPKENQSVKKNIKKETISSSAAPKATSSHIPKYNTSTLHLEPSFNTTAEQLFLTLLDPQRIAAWSRSPPLIEPTPAAVGSIMKLFGGSITSKITKLVPNEQIVQDWRLEDWKDGHFAHLNISLNQGSSETKMVVKFDGIPVGEEDRVRGNFEDYYIRSIKITFGFGAVL
ncbi:hypothetical protein CANTEDRAFT_112346 [Yamadazyma tenuis ATCC 10573]|uniref:Activator of Hsp90 ATPase AHSA1-like N-terminal domain-containing protein n=2 Tax=Candida tenuis TaxID=2315449 RepID=G3AWW6_CANTC|nr:uncharacterized protein CANTEDRAFT_112346 [Yamadazyma tenuis ATCC 10573]EGV66637.1 hypothetical protein CANTEDRAFT_112346 [Yamadazyma tenuis ATCC 10573]